MAEFDFYGTWDDCSIILGKLDALGIFTFVIDKWYDKRVPLKFTLLDEEAKSVIRRQRRVYLWSNDYSLFPPDFGKPRDAMMIDERSSGPALDLTLPPCFERGGKICLGRGYLGHLTYYRNPITNEYFKPPETMRHVFTKLRSLLRKDMVKRYIDDRTIAKTIYQKPSPSVLWIGLHAMSLIESGKAGILFGNYTEPVKPNWKTGTELALTRTDAIQMGNQIEEI